jgi:predicted ATP-grasp superfamily ATP-dependent carboligase
MQSASSFPGSGAVVIGGDYQGLGIARNLAPLKIPVYLIDQDFCIARYSKYVKKYFRCPRINGNGDFHRFLVRLAEGERLRDWVLFPTMDMAVHVIARGRKELERHYRIPTPEWEITKYLYDKKLTYEIARETGVPVPRTLFPRDEREIMTYNLDYPVILKPSIKDNYFPFTLQKAVRADNREELIRRYRRMASVIDPAEIMLQEFIQGCPDNLYSFCCLFSDNRVKAKLVAKRPRQHPMQFGTATTYAYTCNIPELEEPATRVLKRVGYYGLCEVEFMRDQKEGAFKLLEINPRTWGWHTLGSRAGVNFSYLLYLDMNGIPVQPHSSESGVKWIRELTDSCIAASEMWRRRLNPLEYLKSVRGKKELAVYRSEDPAPFFVELLCAPYFLYKKKTRIHNGGCGD